MFLSTIKNNNHVKQFTRVVDYEEAKDFKEVIRIRISKTNRQHNGQKKTDKRANNDVQSNTVNSGAPEGSIVICNLYHSIFSIVAKVAEVVRASEEKQRAHHLRNRG
jgi:hypothetical protein